MPAFRPISRADLIRALRTAGFDGPSSSAKHEYMFRGNQRVWIPNPHRGVIDIPLLGRVIKQAGISRDEWERL
jgi:hypothetical protein